MENVDNWGRNILGRGKNKCKGGEVTAIMAYLTASRRLMWLERNKVKEKCKR